MAKEALTNLNCTFLCLKNSGAKCISMNFYFFWRTMNFNIWLALKRKIYKTHVCKMEEKKIHEGCWALLTFILNLFYKEKYFFTDIFQKTLKVILFLCWNKTLKICLSILFQKLLEEAKEKCGYSIYNLSELMRSWSVRVCFCAYVFCVLHMKAVNERGCMHTLPISSCFSLKVTF